MIYAENVFICIAVPLLVAILFTKNSARRMTTSVLTGMLVCLLSAYIGGFLQLASRYSSDDMSIFLSPIVEEFMKFLPLLFCLYIFEPTYDELRLTAVGIGAGFATFENCCFILTSGAQNLGYVLIRGSAVGVMHVVTMVAIVAGLHLLKTYKVFSFSGVIGALALSVTFHSLYNLLVSKPGVSSYIGYILPMLFALVLYLLNHLSKEFDEDQQA